MIVSSIVKHRNYLFVVLIILGLLSLGNTNSNPNPFIERIFIPIHINGSTLHYGALISFFIIFYGLKQLYEHSQWNIINSRFKRVLIVGFLVYVVMTNWDSGLRMVKSYSNDLNSIYCYRDSMQINLRSNNDEELKVQFSLKLENCGDKDQEFFIKFDMPRYFQDEISEDGFIEASGKDRPFILEAGQSKNYFVEFFVDNIKFSENWASFSEYFEFSLYNESQNLKFKLQEMHRS